MTIQQARDELEQYVITIDISGCPGRQWGYSEHQHIRVSRQLCLFEDCFPTPQAYAAHCTWTKSIRALLYAKPARVPKPPKPTHVPASLQANTWYWREVLPLLKKIKA